MWRSTIRRLLLTSNVWIVIVLVATMLGVIFLSVRTSILPKASVSPNEKPSLLFGPSLYPAREATPDPRVPTPNCTVDDQSCVTCCTIIDGKSICQNKACPAYNPQRIE